MPDSKLPKEILQSTSEKLKSRSAILRLEGIGELEQYGEIAIPQLLEMKKDNREDIRRAANWALEDIGEPTIKPLIGTLRWNNDVYGAVPLLIRMGNPCIPYLLEAMKSDNYDTRKHVINILVGIGVVDLEKIKKNLKKCVKNPEDHKAKREAAEQYLDLIRTLRRNKERIDIPGELLPARIPKPPKKTFRQGRVAHV